MPDSLAHQLFFGATRAIHEAPPAKHSTQAPTTAGCACCGRAWEETEAPTVAYRYKYSSGQAIEQYCTGCYATRIGNPTALGVERSALGNPDNPVYGKLGMLPGSSGIILQGRNNAPELHLGLPNGFMTKFSDGYFAKAGQTHPYANGFALFAYLFQAGFLTMDRLAQGIVFVESWGKKADILMGNLRSSRSLSEVWCCSDAGASMLDLASIIQTGRYLHAAGVLEKTAKTSFWSPIKAATEGKSRAGALEKWATSVQKLGLDPQELVNQLPIDPHSRLRVGPVLQQLAPAISEGVF